MSDRYTCAFVKDSGKRCLRWRLGLSFYCERHKCPICARGTMGGLRYCILHECSVDGCIAFVDYESEVTRCHRHDSASSEG